MNRTVATMLADLLRNLAAGQNQTGALLTMWEGFQKPDSRETILAVSKEMEAFCAHFRPLAPPFQMPSDLSELRFASVVLLGMRRRHEGLTAGILNSVLDAVITESAYRVTVEDRIALLHSLAAEMAVPTYVNLYVGRAIGHTDGNTEVERRFPLASCTATTLPDAMRTAARLLTEAAAGLREDDTLHLRVELHCAAEGVRSDVVYERSGDADAAN